MSTFKIPQDAFTQELQAIGRMIDKDQLRKAATSLNLARAERPADARVLLMGMRLAQKAGNLPMAIKSARQALQMEPTWHVPMIELAQMLSQSHQAEEAMTLARKAARLEPENFQVMLSAAQVAERCNADETVVWAAKAAELQPQRADLKYALANKYVHRQQWDEAMAIYGPMLEANPHDVNGLLGRLSVAFGRKDTAQAQADADTLLELMPNDETIQFWHAQAHGVVPSSQPKQLVAHLFDEMAGQFDHTLVQGLQYKLPEKVAQMLVDLHPDRKFNLLDLGCGTGLLGLYLRRIQGHIIGVDLSTEMIRQAAKHNIYSRFHTVNLVDALRETPSDTYEAITCLDALIYVGDLTTVVPNALRVLKPGGHFIFSCEVAGEDEADLVLRPSGRYAHKQSKVEQLCQDAGFAYVHIEAMPKLRMEGGEPQKGFLVVARKAVV
ncbi:hypothetical protein CCO03_18385 [Comamonas serinivorans]|uniref:Methyltransferase domain-containing protein n=1 Tax=Comamonas serinivorans TaxID=1082851 RepID=A0A1Y0ES11_9BURK|nr:methyltransferase domain-containing protein [Comamonas serinivorans]ARU06366.1 hypothetical protein CCO03_18385 [Comamonas serinivorans]